jgi:hypothetical protein
MPPMHGPRATQVARTLGALVPLGWHSTVVCLDPRRGGPHWLDGAEAATLDGVDVIRVPSPEEWPAVRAAWRLLPALRDRPDSTWVWIGRAAGAAEAAASTTKFDGLATFAQPWSDHLVGLRVHRATGLPWMAHFSDPWVDSLYMQSSRARRLAARRMEEDVVREAASVVFVSRQTADLVMKKYPDEWRSRVAVVAHGFEGSIAHESGSDGHRTGPLRLVYTGRFYDGLRTPVSLLRAIARANAHQPLDGALDVTFVGPHVTPFARDAAQLGIESLVHFRDRVSAMEALAIAENAHALLVIDAPTEGPSPFLPSKLIDYLPLRKPILGVTPPAGATADLLKRLGCPTAPPDDVEAIEAVVTDLVQRWREGTLAVSPQFDRVAGEFDIRRTATQLSGVLTRAFDSRVR